MAIDPKAPTASEPTASPIENEIAAYRAISPLALASLGLGVLSALSFADPTFLIAGVLAVAVGALADWRIRTRSDVLTGRGFAQAGIGLGLIFSLASLTTGFVGDFLLKREAAVFGKQYAQVIASGDLAQAVYLKIPHAERQEMTPNEALDRLNAPKADPMARTYEVGAIEAIMKRLKDPGAHLEFAEIEQVGYEGLTPIAAALLEVHGPKTKEHPDEEQYALVEIKADAAGHPRHWYAAQVAFPYKRQSYTVPEKKPDDGHGHSH